MKRAILLAIPLLLALLSVPAISTNVPVNVTVTSYLTATFQYTQVSYGSLSAGTVNQSAPNQATGIYNVSVSTNANYKVEGSGTNFSDGAGHTFSVSNLRMDTDTTPGGLALGNSVALSGTPQTIDTGIAYTVTTHYHGFWLSIPSGQYANPYSSTVTITYSNV